MVFIALLLQFLSGLYLNVVSPNAAASPLANNPTTKTENKAASEQLAWSPVRRLNWEDFKGQPDDQNPHHALTAANLAVDAKWKNNQFIYEVKCVFLPTESWSKNKKSEKLLAHEQLHFDLTEVHARQLRRALQKMSYTSGTENMKASLNETVSAAFKAWKEEQRLFDQLSNHGLNAEVQQEWTASVDARLKNLEAYQ